MRANPGKVSPAWGSLAAHATVVRVATSRHVTMMFMPKGASGGQSGPALVRTLSGTPCEPVPSSTDQGASGRLGQS